MSVGAKEVTARYGSAKDRDLEDRPSRPVQDTPFRLMEPEQVWIKVDYARTAWQVDHRWAHRLFNEVGLRWEEWQRAGWCQIVKQSVHRTIVRVNLPGQAIFLKHYHGGLWPWCRQQLWNSKAEQEWLGAQLLRQRGISTVTPVAVGKLADGASYFVSLDLGQARPLCEYLEWKRRTTSYDEMTDFRIGLAREFGRFLAKLFVSGLIHHDLHGHNVLVEEVPDGSRKWIVVDTYEVVRPTRLSWKKRLFKHFMLGLVFGKDVSATDNLRCWRAFRESCGSILSLSRDQERLILSQLRDAGTRQIRYFSSTRVNRCIKANREFYQLRSRRCRAWASRTISADRLNQLMDAPAAPWTQPGTKILKTARHAQVGLIAGDRSLNKPMIYKRFTARSWVDALIQFWRSSPAKRCYHMAYRLQLLAIPTARPLAVIHEHRHGATAFSYLLTEYLPQTTDLATYLSAPQLNQDHKKTVLAQVTGILRRLHQSDISHRDLKCTNVLVLQRPGKKPKAVLIDLRGVRHHRWITRSRKLKDLARWGVSAKVTLKLSRSEMLRELQAYLGPLRGAWRWWWYAIAQQMSRKTLRNRKRGRPLS